MRKFFSKLKGDLKQLFGYPDCQYGVEFTVDYAAYWKRRRGDREAYFSPWQKIRADRTLRIIEPGSSVIDLGCGDGAVLGYLKEQANISGIGVDMDRRMLDKACQLGIETIEMDIGDIEKIKTLPETDYILGFEIFEHIPNPERLLCHLMSKARKGIIFSVPNTGYYAHRLRLLFGKFPLQWIVHPGEHLRFWTARDMKFWVRSMGLDLKRLILYEGLPVLNKISSSLFSQGMIIHIAKYVRH